MAKFKNELPTDLIKEFESLNMNTEKMLGEMTKAGAEKVLANVKANAPTQIKNSDMMKCLKITRVYKTPSDKGINTKVGFYGYFKTKPSKTGKTKEVPAPLVANLFEYGSSKRSYPKKPFFRKSFKKKEIEAEMLKVQEKYIKGD